jgi:hypothetical protein
MRRRETKKKKRGTSHLHHCVRNLAPQRHSLVRLRARSSSSSTSYITATVSCLLCNECLCEKRHSFLNFPYVCPEPVLVK